MKASSNFNEEDIPEFITAAEAAKFLGVSVSTVLRWRREKKLRTFRLNNVTRIERQDFLNFIKANTSGPEDGE